MLKTAGIGFLGLSNHEQDTLLAAYDIIKNLHDTMDKAGLWGIEKTSTGEIIENNELLRTMGILDGLANSKSSEWNGMVEAVPTHEEEDWSEYGKIWDNMPDDFFDEDKDKDETEEEMYDETDFEEWDEDALTEAIKQLLEGKMR